MQQGRAGETIISNGHSRGNKNCEPKAGEVNVNDIHRHTHMTSHNVYFATRYIVFIVI